MPSPHLLSSVNPRSFTRATTPYQLVDGARIANNWADLTDGTLLQSIDQTETGGVPPETDSFPSVSQAWTSTKADGTFYAASRRHCANWSSTGSLGGGRTGDTSTVNAG